jgi:hypothetical protein
MNISDLIKAAEAGFSSVSIDTKREGIEISSGGNDVPGDANVRTEPAALYATEELALEAWLAEFNRSIAREDRSLIWVERPYIETYRITLGDQYNSYRIVRDRFVARGKVLTSAYVGETPEPDVPLPTEVLKPKRKAKAA